MGCINKTVFLYVESLLHDIDAELLKFSKMIADGEPNQELQTDETANNRPLMLRRIDYHIGQLNGIMQAYVLDIDRKATDNFMREYDEYEIRLSFPENWSRGTFIRLPLEMHNYIVNGCIADFLKSARPNEANTYQSVADACLWNVKHCVTSRNSESMRLPQSMF